jgi:hypothetical protein
MTTSFAFNEKLLEACATSESNADACSQLYEHYCEHYYGHHSTDGSRRRRFLETVNHVYHHNNNQASASSFRLTLNQFADQDLTNSTQQWQEGWYQPWNDIDAQDGHDDMDDAEPTRPQDRLLLEGVPFTKLDSVPAIQRVLTGHHSSNKHHKNKHHKKNHHHKAAQNGESDAPPLELSLRKHMSSDPFAIVELPSIADGMELDVTHRAKKRHHDGFSNSLNWATKNNPDGVLLVHDVFDQVNAGCYEYFFLRRGNDNRTHGLPICCNRGVAVRVGPLPPLAL